MRKLLRISRIETSAHGRSVSWWLPIINPSKWPLLLPLDIVWNVLNQHHTMKKCSPSTKSAKTNLIRAKTWTIKVNARNCQLSSRQASQGRKLYTKAHTCDSREYVPCTVENAASSSFTEPGLKLNLVPVLSAAAVPDLDRILFRRTITSRVFGDKFPTALQWRPGMCNWTLLRDMETSSGRRVRKEWRGGALWGVLHCKSGLLHWEGARATRAARSFCHSIRCARREFLRNFTIALAGLLLCCWWLTRWKFADGVPHC